MVRVERSVDLDASREEVWAYVVAPERYPGWIDGLDGVRVLEEGVDFREEGARYRGRLGPTRIAAEWRVREWNPPRRQAHRIETSVSSATIAVEVASVGGNARLRVAVDSRVLPRARPLGRLIERGLVERVLSRRMRRRLATIERGIERP